MRSSTVTWRSALAARWLATSLLVLPALAVAQPRKPVVPKPAPQQPMTPPPGLTSPVTSAVGKPIGAAVSKLIGAEGGSVSAGAVTITVPAGAVTGATVQLQPVSDELNGSGQGMAINIDAPLQKPLLVTFRFPPDDPNSSATSLAVQQGDGSWTSFAPVRLNEAAGTVTGALSPEMIVESKKGAPAASKGVHIVKYLMGWISPDAVTLKPGEKQEFRPRARVFVDPPPGCPAMRLILPEDLKGQFLDTPELPKCLTKVMREYNIANRDPAYFRAWTINGGPTPGNDEVGWIDQTARYGVTYTAPKEIPNDFTVNLRFVTSFNNDPACKAPTYEHCSERTIVLGPARAQLLGPVKYVATVLEPVTDDGVPGGLRIVTQMDTLWFECERIVHVCNAKGLFTITGIPREPDASGCVTRMQPAKVTVDVADDLDENPSSSGTLIVEPADSAVRSDSARFQFEAGVMAVGGRVKTIITCPNRPTRGEDSGAGPIGSYVLLTPHLTDGLKIKTSPTDTKLVGTWDFGAHTYHFVLLRVGAPAKEATPKSP